MSKDDVVIFSLINNTGVGSIVFSCEGSIVGSNVGCNIIEFMDGIADGDDDGCDEDNIIFKLVGWDDFVIIVGELDGYMIDLLGITEGKDDIGNAVGFNVDRVVGKEVGIAVGLNVERGFGLFVCKKVGIFDGKLVGEFVVKDK